ncbi:MAG: dihydrolipoamide acetyltransferase family protein [Acidimicrobiia bacterium]
MSTTVTMPQLGETVTEGTILSWAKKPGESIAADEILFEVSTDKVDTEVPSPVAGTVLEILVEAGVTVPVGTPLIVIGEAGEVPASEPASAPEPSPQPPSVPAPEPSPQPPSVPAPEPVAASIPVAEEAAVAPVSPEGAGSAPSEPGEPAEVASFLSPVVRKLANEHNLDLSKIVGTGRAGRITRKDVLQLIDAGGGAAPVAPATAPAPAAAAPAVATPVASVPPGAIPVMEGDDVRDLDRIRTRIGTNMILAKQTAAHVWTSVEVDYERVERVRQRHRASFKAREGFSLTYMPFIARATIDALNAFPVVNSSYYLEEKKAVFHARVNLGVAIDLDQGGLIVATIHDSDGLRMIGLARRVRDLADKARAGNLEPDDVAGSTFTITNPGPFGSFMSAAIINVPNTGILSTDTVKKRPTVITNEEGQDMIAIRHIGYLGLTWDHRAFDGSTAVLFLRKIKENLETWDWEQELN